MTGRLVEPVHIAFFAARSPAPWSLTPHDADGRSSKPWSKTTWGLVAPMRYR
jgi:hypothetical protein